MGIGNDTLLWVLKKLLRQILPIIFDLVMDWLENGDLSEASFAEHAAKRRLRADTPHPPASTES
jgi:hypothetical protein